MRSSTSSSNPHMRIDANFGLSVTFAVVLFIVFVACFELGLRMSGIDHISVTDDMALWSMQREKIDKAQDTSNMVVLLGGSRMQLGFSSKAFRETYPDKGLVRLGISGAKPIAALKDIAENTGFQGVVLMAVYVPAISLSHIKAQQPYIDYYLKNWSFDKRLNRQIKLFLEERFVSQNPRYGFLKYVKGVVNPKRELTTHYLTIERDRSNYADYSMVPREKLEKSIRKRKKVFVKQQPRDQKDAQIWLAGTVPVEEMVKKITGRGGRVVFIRFPNGYDLWQQTHGKLYPNNLFWDAYAKQSRADFIHFADYQALHFDSPDGSHIDMKDIDAFTLNLLEVLKNKGLM